MARHIWTVLCESSVVDKDTNIVSLFNALERITLIDLPEEEDWPINVPVNFHLVTLWLRSHLETPEESRARVTIEGVDQAKRVFEPYGINLTGDFIRFRQIVRFSGLQLGGLGVVWFIIELGEGDDWKEVARVPLEIRYGPLEE